MIRRSLRPQLPDRPDLDDLIFSDEPVRQSAK